MANLVVYDCAEHDIDAVTVFMANRAEIKRTIQVDLKNGQNEVEIKNLSSYLDKYSIQVDGMGKAVISNVIYHSPEPLKQSEGSTIRSLSSSEKKRLEAELTIYDKQAKILEAYSKTLSSKETNAEDLDKFLDLFASRQRRLDESVSALDKELDEVDRKLANAPGEISIVVVVEDDGEVTLSLTYMVANAWWEPQYDLRASIAHDTKSESRFHLHYRASINQNTGEDWSNVALTLSTSSSLQGTDIPTLEPLWIKNVPDAPPRSHRVKSRVSFHRLSASRDQSAPIIVAPPRRSRSRAFFRSPFSSHPRSPHPRSPPYTRSRSPASSRSRSRSQSRVHSPSRRPTPTRYTYSQPYSYPYSSRSPSLSYESVGSFTPSPQPIPLPRVEPLVVSYRSTEVDGYAHYTPPAENLRGRDWNAADKTVDTTFTIPGRSSIRSDSNSGSHTHQVPVAEIDFDSVELEWVTVPKAIQSVFLRCHIQNTSKYVLLAGPMNVFLNDNFVARSDLTHVNPRQSFTCSLGVDLSVRVTYHPQRRETKAAIALAAGPKATITTFRQNVTITNKKKTHIGRLVMKDQVPVSRDTVIKVNVLEPKDLNSKMVAEPVLVRKGVKAHWTQQSEESWAGDEHNAKEFGFIDWICELSAGETMELRLAWEIVHPPGVDVDWRSSRVGFHDMMTEQPFQIPV